MFQQRNAASKKNLHRPYKPSSLDQKKIPEPIPSIVETSKKSGKLNLSDKGLDKIPNALWAYYEKKDDNVTISLDAMAKENYMAWWEVVPLSNLVLAYNSISLVEPEIAIFANLVNLDLRHNLLCDLPDELGLLTELTSLNISGNSFAQLPTCIEKLPLLSFYAQGNQLTSSQTLESTLLSLKNIKILDISQNQLTTLPASLFQRLPSLAKLNVSQNKIIKLPTIRSTEANFGAELIELNVSKNLLTNIFEVDIDNNSSSNKEQEVLYLPNINIIQAHDNKLQFMCSTNSKLDFPSLRELHLNNNLFQSVGNTIVAPKIEIALLRDNQLSSFPSVILQWHSLKRLDVANNLIPNLPPELSLLPHLDLVVFEGNPTRTIPRSITTTKALLRLLLNRIEDPKNDKTVVSITSQASNIPKSFSSQEIQSKCVHFAEMFLTDETLEEKIDSAKIPFQPLTLHLQNNLLKKIPNCLQTFQTLQHLVLHHNRISSLLVSSDPLDWQLPRLVSLDISFNELKNLGNNEEEVRKINRQFPMLREFRASHNQITNLPSTFPFSDTLQSLYLDGNKISTITLESFFHGRSPAEETFKVKLPMLEVLDFKNNDISTLPPLLGLLPVKVLIVEGNRFRVPNYTVIREGTESVKRFLKMRIPGYESN